jgi:hypothetical protein
MYQCGPASRGRTIAIKIIVVIKAIKSSSILVKRLGLQRNVVLEDEDIEINSSEHSKFLQRFLAGNTNVHSSNNSYIVLYLQDLFSGDGSLT